MPATGQVGATAPGPAAVRVYVLVHGLIVGAKGGAILSAEVVCRMSGVVMLRGCGKGHDRRNGQSGSECQSWEKEFLHANLSCSPFKIFVEQIWPAIVSAFPANLIGNIGGLDAQNGSEQRQDGENLYRTGGARGFASDRLNPRYIALLGALYSMASTGE
jgi:hypothetical protein